MDIQVPIDDEVVSSLTSATTLASVPTRVRAAEIQAIGGNVRWRFDTAPTATTGGLIYKGYSKVFPFGKADLEKLQFIEETSGVTAFALYTR